MVVAVEAQTVLLAYQEKATLVATVLQMLAAVVAAIRVLEVREQERLAEMVEQEQATAMTALLQLMHQVVVAVARSPAELVAPTQVMVAVQEQQHQHHPRTVDVAVAEQTVMLRMMQATARQAV